MPPGTQRVPFEGPDDYKIMFVGEAPGAEEQAQGRPFIGKAGELLRRYVQRAGLKDADVMYANLSKYRPGYNHNKFEALLQTDELKEGIIELKEEINRANPNCIVALGGWPMFFLTGISGTNKRGSKDVPVPGSGISLYRGSRLPAVDSLNNTKVFCTYHPSFILRAWKENPVFLIDLIHAAEDSKYPELNYPTYEEYIDPPENELIDLTHEAISSGLIAQDIETFKGGTFSCTGWAWKKDGVYKSVCTTYLAPSLHKYSKEVWESDTPKIFQYGTYDCIFMKNFYNWNAGGFYDGLGWDTYIATASLLPDYPRGLDFLCSIYTRFPYYKTERKEWRIENDMMKLWKYNIKDCVGTYMIAEEQMKETAQVYGSSHIRIAS